MEYSADMSIDAANQVASFWELAKHEAENLKPDQNNFKTQDLPLARIKKIMKLDDDVKSMMISAEAPILFAKAAELFIRELTLRAWLHTDRNRRRTLQRNDISMAVSYGDTDQFDFLIDIVPRDEGRGHRRSQQQHAQTTLQHMAGTSLVQQTQVQVMQQHQQAGQQAGGDDVAIKSEAAPGGQPGASAAATTTLVANADGTLTTVSGQPTVQFATLPSAATGTTASGQQIQYVIQLPANSAASNGQPFQIQMLPQQFQAASTDAVATAQLSGALVTAGGIAGATATPGGIQLVQVVNPQAVHSTATAVSSTTVTSAPGADHANKLQTVHVQLSDLASGTQTLLVQPSGAAMVVAAPSQEEVPHAHNSSAAGGPTATTTLVSVDGGETYTPAQVFTTAAAAGNGDDIQGATAVPTTADDNLMQTPTSSTAAVEQVDAPGKLKELSGNDA